MPSLQGKDLAIALAQETFNMQAEDVRVFDLKDTSSLTCFTVICSASSLPHLKAIVEQTEENLLKATPSTPSIYAEGNPQSRWMILDYIDVILHVLHTDTRPIYALEKFWIEEGGEEILWKEEKNSPS